MFGRKLFAAGVLLTVGASVSIACGPFFAWQLLDDRTATLKSTPKNTFAYETQHLVRPADGLKAVEPSAFESDADRANDFDKVEEQGLSPQQIATLTASRNDATGDQSFTDNASLPSAVRLYEAGILDFHKSNPSAASARFEAILSLPAAERAPRVVWAAYMLGRIAVASGDAAGATAKFAATRQLVQNGAPDPLGLAVASFGEEAKLHYDHANGLLTGTPPAPAPAPVPAYPGAPVPPVNPTFEGYSLPPENAPAYRDEMAAATALYAEQAARNSDSGVQSLRMIAQDVLAVPERIDAAVPAPQVQRLLVVYALARIDDDATQDQGPHDAGTRERGIKLNPLLPTLLESIVKFGGRNPADADRLAALGYRTGRYDLAAQLAAESSSPLAEWVKAKIALQKGDLAGAAVHYAAASKGFPEARDTNQLDSDNANLVVGEQGALALARGEYVDALDKLYPVATTYWGDVAYIAERVLTVDELKNFVDTKVPAAKDAPTPSQYGAPPADPAAQLRNLLARRLMRDGRSDEAFAYFNDPRVRGAAQAYATALHDSKSDWGKVDRAQALFTAATLARVSGMDILGTETGPDYYNVSGLYDCCIGQDAPKGAYVAPEERARAAASVVQPNIRYHYRYLAVDDASRAADLLPARSQAFASVLCKATGWMMQTPGEDARAKALYTRYVKNGARGPWAKSFGHKCPDPDFARAITMERSQLYHHWRHYASVHRWWLVGFVLLIGAAGTFGAMRLRKSPSKLGVGARGLMSRISDLFRKR